MAVPVVARFTTKRHSTRPYLRLFIQNKDGTPFSLTGVSSANFFMADKAGTMKVDSPAVIESVSGGILRYEWKAPDLDTTGEFFGEFKLAYTAGGVMKAPLQGNIIIRIYEDVEDD